MYGAQDSVEEQQEPEELGMWEKHQAKMDAKKQEEQKD